MKKALLLLVLLSVIAAAQQSTPPPEATNVVQKEITPTYTDVYCSGFITSEPIARENYVVGGVDTPTAAMYAKGDTVFLKGSGYQPGQRFTVIRAAQDPNRDEPFRGQRALLHQTGTLFAEVAQVRVLKVIQEVAIAQIEFGCQSVTPGDLVMPFQEKPPVSYRKDKVAFDRFPGQGTPAGRIVLAKDFDVFLGTRAKVYITAGAQKGIKVGDYLRVMRGYAPEEMDPAQAQIYQAPPSVDGQAYPPKTGKVEMRQLPRQALGEIVILSVTPTSATGMITFAFDSIKVGDAVEVETPQQ